MFSRVAVVGMGVVSPIGNSLDESWEALRAGRSGIGPITRFDAGHLPWKYAGELKGFKSSLPPKDIKRLDPFVHYAYEAAMMAVEDAGLKERDLGPAGIIIGSGRGGIVSLEDGAIKRPTAYLMSGSTISMAPSFIAQRFGIRGRALGISTACSSGANAIGEAVRLIRHGYAEVVLAGGSEAPICGLCVRGYGISGALSKSGISRPFDKKRDGFVIAEGSAILVLEEYESALRRGAMVYGEIIGYGNASDAFHQTAPDMEGQSRAMRAALNEAGITADDVDYISAHATSTPVGDIAEAQSVRLVFGDKIPVAANKSATGHMLGASGAFEAAMALMSMKEGIIPPTINLDEPEGGLNYVTKALGKDIRVVVSNSFGFGGVNSVLVFKKL